MMLIFCYYCSIECVMLNAGHLNYYNVLPSWLRGPGYRKQIEVNVVAQNDPRVLGVFLFDMFLLEYYYWGFTVTLRVLLAFRSVVKQHYVLTACVYCPVLSGPLRVCAQTDDMIPTLYLFRFFWHVDIDLTEWYSGCTFLGSSVTPQSKWFTVLACCLSGMVVCALLFHQICCMCLLDAVR